MNLQHRFQDSAGMRYFPLVLVDCEGDLYTFQNDIPVLFQDTCLTKVGIGQLNRKRKKLYAEISLHKTDCCFGAPVFPHLLHNVQGHIVAILLSIDPPQDHSIQSLPEIQ